VIQRLSGVWAGAGLGCFGLAYLMSGYLPIAHLSRIQYQLLDELAPAPSLAFLDLAKRYPEPFAAAFGAATTEAYRDALRLGRATYIAEGCWHCHSQFVRPVSGEDARFGKVAYAAEYMNELNLPHLFGTRRVGPDLSRIGGKYGNDWHVAHFYDPRSVVPTSVMPRYPWLFDGELPNRRGLALIAYVQWLGSWVDGERGAGLGGVDDQP
jgi:hypothetical protein